MSLALAVALFQGAAFSAVRTLSVPGPPVFADTECSVDIPFAAARPYARNFGFSIEADLSPSNSLEVAFGCDSDEDGALGVFERKFRFAWDAGEWIMGGADFANVSHDVPATVEGEKIISWRIRLSRSGESERLAIKENGEPLFAVLEGAVPEYAYDPLWDMVHITARGTHSDDAQLRLECSPDGLFIFIK